MTSEPTFHSLFWLLLGAVLVMRLYFVVRLRQRGERLLPDRKAIQQEGQRLFIFRLTSWLLMLGLLVSYALNLAWMDRFLIGIPDGLRWLGFIVGVISVLFWTWTQITLGREWSPQLHLQEKHTLITAGPYAHIRHPMYTSIVGFGVGLALIAANWIFVVLAALVIAGLFLRIPREEQMLIEEFGETYRAYMQRTGSWYPR